MKSIENIFHRCLSGPFKGELTAHNVSLYHIAPFNIYCEKFIPADEKDPMRPYRELLLEIGLEHEHRVMENKYPECRAIHFETPEEGFREILDKMARGADVICGLPLLYLPENMQGRIDVLEKKYDHPSVFGKYHYTVTEIKLAKKIRKEHILQAAFYTHMLAKIQEYLPEKFRIINHDLETLEYYFSDYEAELLRALKGTQAILDGIERPTATYNASEWPWERYGNHRSPSRALACGGIGAVFCGVRRL